MSKVKTRRVAPSNGVVLYEGPSMLDGAPIVVIATGLKKKSSNAKTGGGLIQTWILRADIKPTDAVKSGDDASICGACPHRGIAKDGRNTDRSCYVTVFQAPLNIWKTWKRGRYPVATGGEFAGRMVRLGAYGDPAAAPFDMWDAAMAGTVGHTGYTHQWRDYPAFSKFCMASCDTSGDRVFAGFMGFRTFRVTGDASRESGEIVCPASAEAGHKTLCSECKACGGTTAKARADVVIRVHGAKSKVNAHARNARTAAIAVA